MNASERLKADREQRKQENAEWEAQSRVRHAEEKERVKQEKLAYKAMPKAQRKAYDAAYTHGEKLGGIIARLGNSAAEDLLLFTAYKAGLDEGFDSGSKSGLLDDLFGF